MRTILKKSIVGLVSLVFLVAFNLIIANSACSLTLWYNGESDGYFEFPAIYPFFDTQATVYDDFLVPSGGWTIDSVWAYYSTNFLLPSTSPDAFWEIRSGVSVGNGGTVVASSSMNPGYSVSQDVSSTSPPNYFSTIEVTGLDIFLPGGTYWLAVTPVAPGISPDDERALIAATRGINAIGTPAGDNGNSFVNGTVWNTTHNFASINETNFTGFELSDFSMGVGGTPVPEPATVLLLGTGLVGLVGFRKKFKK